MYGSICNVPSVLWCCWLGGRKGIQPVKNIDMEWWGAGMVICLERGANDLHMVQLMPLPPHHLLLQQNPEWFILLVPAYPGCPGKKAVKRLCVCVAAYAREFYICWRQVINTGMLHCSMLQSHMVQCSTTIHTSDCYKVAPWYIVACNKVACTCLLYTSDAADE